MPKITTSKPTLKKAVKEALAELLVEQPDLFRELLAEAIEDVALLKAMEQGRKTKLVSRKIVLDKSKS